MMRVLHIVPSLDATSGGPAYTVSALCRYLRVNGVDARIVTAYDSSKERSLWERGRFGKDEIPVKAVAGVGIPGYRVFWAPAFSLALRNQIRTFNPHLIHSHGVWRLENHSAVRQGKDAGIPVVLTPRGEISAWALSQKKLKKRIAWYAYQRRDFTDATAIHVTADNELADARELGAVQPILKIPNGVEIPTIDSDVKERDASRKRDVLFLSRIHPKKGVERLIDAWEKIDTKGWRCRIVGPGDADYVERLKLRAAALGAEKEILFSEMVEGAEKWRMFAQADLFVLPTNSENFGVVVAEALAAETPVITTTGAPWKDLEGYDCGWWVEPDTDAVGAALQAALRLSDEQREKMGRRGRELVEKKYSWMKIARDMEAGYRWICGSGPKPDCGDG